MNTIGNALIALLGSFILVSCGGGQSGEGGEGGSSIDETQELASDYREIAENYIRSDANTESVNFIADFHIAQPSLDGSRSANAELSQLNTPMGGNSIVRALYDETSPGCLFKRDGSNVYQLDDRAWTGGLTGEYRSEADMFFDNISAVDAADNLILTSGAGTLADLQKRFVGDYTAELAGTDAIAQDLRFDVPEGNFPALENVVMPVQESLADFSVDGDSINANSRFTWTPGTSGSVMFLLSQAELPSGSEPLENADEPSGPNTSMEVFCIFPDTGTYQFPATIREAMGSDFTGDFAWLIRVDDAFETRGDVLIRTGRSSSAIWNQ